MPEKTPEKVLVTCEHAGNRVPPEYRPLFRLKRGLLDSHRGWDPGAFELARGMAARLQCPLVATQTTRLLVDCNRTTAHPALFSDVTGGLGRRHKIRILSRHYRPHWREVTKAARTRSLHIGVHSFTPVLDGKRRELDVGILYDPARRREREFAERWAEELRRRRPKLRVRMNQPYKGTSDGLTTALRKLLPAKRYAGIELEVNQAFPKGPSRRWTELRKAILDSLEAALSGK